MTWRTPTKLEELLLADTRERWPEVLRLARVLCLAPRIEPLLLRNARRRYLPMSAVELESRLWFSPIVADRSTTDIVLHLGVAKLLADDLLSQSRRQRQARPAADTILNELWGFTCRHTRHWSAEDRLERDLRFSVLRDDQPGLRRGLGAILKHIQSDTSDATRRIDLSRLAKRLLSVVAPSGSGATAEEARVLTQYAALALGDAGSWVEPGSPQALPTALAKTLPSSVENSELGLELRWDPDLGLVLCLVDAAEAEQRIRFPSPLPARLNVAAVAGVGEWHDVKQGTRIRIDSPSGRLHLTTLDGCRWILSTDALTAADGAKVQPRREPLRLIHVVANREQAESIAQWLLDTGVQVQLQVETESTLRDGSTGAEARSVRLWSRAARSFWAAQPLETTAALDEGLLLRIEDVEPPTTGAAYGRVLDWRDWARLSDSPEAERLAISLEQWWRDGELAPESQVVAGEEGPDREIASLLAELQDPSTGHERRVDIADRLAAIGVPRPEVGAVETQAPDDAQEQKSRRETSASSAPTPSSSPGAIKLFVSHSSQLDEVEGRYSRDDRNWRLLKDTCVALRQKYGDRIDLLVDRDGLIPGEDWNHNLDRWLAECNVAILLFSQRAIDKSEWLAKEVSILSWRAELDKDFILIPVLLDGESTPEDLARDFLGVLRIDKHQCISNVRSAADIVAGVVRILGEPDELVLRSAETPLERLEEIIAAHISDGSTTESLPRALDALGIPTAHDGRPVQKHFAALLARRLIQSASESPTRLFSEFRMAVDALVPRPDVRHVTELYRAVRSLWVNPASAAQLVQAAESRQPIAITGGFLLLADEHLETQCYTVDRYLERAFPDRDMPRVIVAGSGYVTVKDMIQEIRKAFLGSGLPPGISDDLQDMAISRDQRTIALILPMEFGLPDPDLLGQITSLYQIYERLLVILALEDQQEISPSGVLVLNPPIDRETEQDAYLGERTLKLFINHMYGIGA